MSQFSGNLTNDPASRYLAAGKQLLEMRRFQEAVGQLTKYVGECPEDPAGHYHLARGYYGLSKFDETIECANQSLAIDPSKAQPLNIIGLALYKKGEWPEAEEHLKRATEIEPNNTEYWLSLAVPSLYRAEWDKVEKCVEEVLKTNPQHPVAFNYKAQLAMQKGDFEKAREYIAIALSKEPERSMHHAVAGQIEGMAGNAKNAKQYFDTAINKDPAQVGHRLRYLNTRFSSSVLGRVYHKNSVWGNKTFNNFYLLLLLNAPMFSMLYLAAKPDSSIVFQVVFAPLLLLLAIYAAIPTLYKLYINEKLWDGEGVDLINDYTNCAMLCLGLLLAAAGFFIINSEVILLGALWLLFSGGMYGLKQIKYKFISVPLFILLIAVPFIMLAIVLQLLGAKLGLPDILKYLQYGIIGGACVIAIALKGAFFNKNNNSK